MRYIFLLIILIQLSKGSLNLAGTWTTLQCEEVSNQECCCLPANVTFVIVAGNSQGIIQPYDQMAPLLQRIMTQDQIEACSSLQFAISSNVLVNQSESFEFSMNSQNINIIQTTSLTNQDQILVESAIMEGKNVICSQMFIQATESDISQFYGCFSNQESCTNNEHAVCSDCICEKENNETNIYCLQYGTSMHIILILQIISMILSIWVVYDIIKHQKNLRESVQLSIFFIALGDAMLNDPLDYFDYNYVRSCFVAVSLRSCGVSISWFWSCCLALSSYIQMSLAGKFDYPRFKNIALIITFGISVFQLLLPFFSKNIIDYDSCTSVPGIWFFIYLYLLPLIFGIFTIFLYILQLRMLRKINMDMEKFGKIIWYPFIQILGYLPLWVIAFVVAHHNGEGEILVSLAGLTPGVFNAFLYMRYFRRAQSEAPLITIDNNTTRTETQFSMGSSVDDYKLKKALEVDQM